YAALLAGANSGVYRSDNNGLVWRRVDNGASPIPAATLTSAVNLLLAASTDRNTTPATTVLWAAIAGNNNLTSVFRSTDAAASTAGASWTALDMPGTTTNVSGTPTFAGLHPFGQGDLHFSFVADPNNPNQVYVGGSIQNTPLPNLVGANNFTGRLFP